MNAAAAGLLALLPDLLDGVLALVLLAAVLGLTLMLARMGF